MADRIAIGTLRARVVACGRCGVAGVMTAAAHVEEPLGYLFRPPAGWFVLIDDGGEDRNYYCELCLVAGSIGEVEIRRGG
jgi:hypothetical protein